MGTPCYIFKVELMDFEDIWRRIAMRANQTLDAFHEAIYLAFDREEEHLYSFYFPRRAFKGRPSRSNSVEYAHPYAAEDDMAWFRQRPCTAAKVKLGALELRPGRVFYYLFDYGDSWWHKITVESIDAPAPKGKPPWILQRHGDSPPQYPDFDEE